MSAPKEIQLSVGQVFGAMAAYVEASSELAAYRSTFHDEDQDVNYPAVTVVPLLGKDVDECYHVQLFVDWRDRILYKTDYEVHALTDMEDFAKLASLDPVYLSRVWQRLFFVLEHPINRVLMDMVLDADLT